MCYGHSISSPSLTLSTNTTPTYTSYVSTVADFALRSLYRQWKVCSDRFLCSVICLVICRQVAEVDLRRYTEVAVRISPERHAGGIAVSCMFHLTDDCRRPHNHHHPHAPMYASSRPGDEWSRRFVTINQSSIIFYLPTWRVTYNNFVNISTHAAGYQKSCRAHQAGHLL